MNITDNYFKNVPEYYPSMYMDGYSPEEIYFSFKRKVYQEQEDREDINNPPEVKITSEVKVR